MSKNKDTAMKINWILLGLVMLIPGLLKLFVMKPAAVTGMLEGFGFPGASFFAWILILGEILSGVLILARYKLDKVVYIPITTKMI